MKEQLIKLANDKGFTSHIIGKAVDAKHSNKDFYHLWMCELQKWLREVHNIDIDITRCNVQNHNDGVGYQYEYITPVIESISDFKIYKTYEEALEKGLQEALKLIK